MLFSSISFLYLFLPALQRLGIADLFDAYATVSETGVPKVTGETYRLAAQRLGVAAEDCIVFEDILEGHLGARAVGMRSCNVYDRHADHRRKGNGKNHTFTPHFVSFCREN